MNTETVELELYPCGCSNHQNFKFQISKRGKRVSFILKCANCCMNTGFQSTPQRAEKVWNECLTGNSFDLMDQCDAIALVVEELK